MWMLGKGLMNEGVQSFKGFYMRKTSEKLSRHSRSIRFSVMAVAHTPVDVKLRSNEYVVLRIV